MKPVSTWIQNLKKKLFGKGPPHNGAKLPSASPAKKTSASQILNSGHSVYKRKEPYFIQIGFDFGTSYSKCVCRDMMANKAWVHFPSRAEGQEFPFLIPSALLVENGKIAHVKNPQTHYPENGLYHLKHALVKVAMGHWDDPVLDPYRSTIGPSDTNQLSRFVEACAVFFLAGALGEVRERVRQRFSGFGLLHDDYMAVNLAVPVGDAEQPEVNRVYDRTIRKAWSLADDLSGHPPIHLTEVEMLGKKNQRNQDPNFVEACFIYPEVSANVQGFVRSRVSSPGTYLFSDIGGGTVDQSVFIFVRKAEGELLTYLSGRVLPLGSSHIEWRAAKSCGKTDCLSLEIWRERKERGEKHFELKEAKEWIAKELGRGTEATLALAKQKLFVKDQLNGIRVIFGGGGHCEHPYKNAVMLPFSGKLFSKPINPDIVGLPFPRDLDLASYDTRWMRRLYVAYGLSFEKSELTRFTYPKDSRTPQPEEIWRPHKEVDAAPTKDEC